jgi:hypothetical protein
MRSPHHHSRDHSKELDIRSERADRAERHGHTREEACKLRQKAAQSAAICGECFRPLSPTDSVTMVWRNIGYWAKHPHIARVPICLLCTLDAIKLTRSRNCWPFYVDSQDKSHSPRHRYRTLHWYRTRCRNCNRPLRLYPYWPNHNRRTCCADCQRALKNERNKLRRRVKHEPIACVQCGGSFIPQRADALTCSNKCRQALHRKQANSAASGSRYVTDNGRACVDPTKRRNGAGPS